MTLKWYLTIMTILTLVCWGAFIFVINFVDPEMTNWIGFSMFYTSLFLAVMGTSTILGFLVRFIALKKELAYWLVKEAFRQSFIFSILIVVILILLSRDLFTWLNLLFLIISLSILELFMLGYGGSKNNKNINY